MGCKHAASPQNWVSTVDVLNARSALIPDTLTYLICHALAQYYLRPVLLRNGLIVCPATPSTRTRTPKGSTECSLCDLRGVLLGLQRSTCHLRRGWHLPLQEFAAVPNESGSTAINPEQSLAKLVLFISLAYLKKLAHVGKSREVTWKALSYTSPPP